MNRPALWLVVLVLCTSACTRAPKTNADAPASKFALAPDKFPTGPGTPEGAACDFARAFIQHDPDTLKSACLDPYGDAETKKKYAATLDQFTDDMKKDLAAPSPKGPKTVGKCFAARHLSHEGPASYAYATFGWQDVMFVDVGTINVDGSQQLCRTLVVEIKPHVWKVHPSPEISPLLVAGSHDEKPSTVDFSETPASAAQPNAAH